MSNELDIRPLTTNTGAEIFGVNLAEPYGPEFYADIRAAMHRYGVVFFRDQDLSDAEYLAFATKFGEPRVNPLTPHVDGFPAIAKLTKETSHETSTGDMWHADHTFLPAPMNTFLRAIELPAFGGDTLWANTRTAYEYLPEQLKDEIAELKALHSHSFLIKDLAYAKKHKQEHGGGMDEDKGGDMDSDMMSATSEMIYHPVVRKHPETGAQTLFVNPGYTVKFEGQSRVQSLDLLNKLYDHCLQPEFQCRFRWHPGSIAMWDNSQTWHFAVNDYAGQRREMQRIVWQ